MDLANKQVTHKIFGTGNVVQYNDSYIKINFSSGNKNFVFPNAFERYLMFTDPTANTYVRKLWQEKKQEHEEKLRLKKLKALQSKILLRGPLQPEQPTTRRGTRKVHPCSQSVFWCKGQEQDSVFAQWDVAIGVIKSGERKGQPRNLARINQNSACLITARETGEPEKDRRILGAFMVDEAFDNKRRTEHYIPAHPKYRLHLSEQESNKILFWNYYMDKRYPHKTTWNTGRHRYFDNIWMAQILRDIVSVKTDPKEKETAALFFEHFCEVNQLDKEELPKPQGTLMLDGE